MGERVILPAKDLINELREKLAPYQVPGASFEEIVRQCLDVYMEWNGEEEQIAMLPYFNRIEVPALFGDQYQNVYESVSHAVQNFAQQVYLRLMRYGFFPKTNIRPNMDFTFERFVLGGDIVLSYFPF
jgi:hypothetical protein